MEELERVCERYRKAWAAERAAQARIEAAEAEVKLAYAALNDLGTEYNKAQRALFETILGEDSAIRRG